MKSKEEITEIRRKTNKLRKDYLARLQIIKDQMDAEDCIELSLAEVVDMAMNQGFINLGKYKIVYDGKEPTIVSTHFKITFNRDYPNEPS